MSLAPLVIERRLRHAPEKVWRAITTDAILADWLFPNDFKPLVGASFTMRAPPGPHWDGRITGTVLLLDPPRRLSIRWRSDAGIGGPPLDTVVTFTLDPDGDGTSLRLEQDGFLPGQARNRAGAEIGWPRFLEALDQTLLHRSGEPS